MLPVMLDGCVAGHIHRNRAEQFCVALRRLKVSAAHPTVPATLEVACLLPAQHGDGQTLLPSVQLFSVQARMVRPVWNIAAGAVEWVGSFEQVFMEVACQDEDRRAATTHQELAPPQMLSLAASRTPFSDFNPSPRNMYQCQMMKQTMGTPIHAWVFRADTKMYRIQTPQTPICRNAEYVNHGIDDYSMGTNAVVAVISYTGYDMEDAMIINKSAFERGFGHGSMYTSEVVDLDEQGEAGETWVFDNPLQSLPDGQAERACPTLDPHGLPHIGSVLKQGDPLYSCVSDTTGRVDVHNHKKSEDAIVDEVRLVGSQPSAKGRAPLRRVNIKLRYNRNPVIGDKFSSRHGQKGTLAQLWPERNMPFTESGMTPDIIINPHAFPSRMTIGMLIESMAGKAGAIHGIFHASTPFVYNEVGSSFSAHGPT
jgi:DNA-directed RNA polymerase I subunit RPA2